MTNASFTTFKCTGSGAATKTDCSHHPCFLSADVVSTDTASYPVTAPLSGSTNYSYELWLKLRCTSAPVNRCENFEFYGSQAQPDSFLTVFVGTVAAGATPTSSKSGVAVDVVHTTRYSPGTALPLGVDPGDGKIDAVNEETNYIVLQLGVEVGATRGTMQTFVPTLSWDEV